MNHIDQTIADLTETVEKVEQSTCWCLVCNPKVGFPSIDALQAHTKDKHRTYKG